MPRKGYQEFSLLDAEALISDFFHRDQTLTDVFNAICAHMLDLESGFVLRVSGNIIGLCKPNEYYRFYVLQKDGSYFIKYKHREENDAFLPSLEQEYFAYNIACNQFFEENLVYLVKKGHPAFSKRNKENRPYGSVKSTQKEWEAVKNKAQRARLLISKTLSEDYIDTVYGKLIRLLTDACWNEDIVSERNGNIIIQRILKSPPVTLQELGDQYNVSRERIRQCEERAWGRITIGIYKSRKKSFVPYREELKIILSDVPDDVFLEVVARIRKRSEPIGDWINMIISAEPDKPSDETRPTVQKKDLEIMKEAARYYHAELKKPQNAQNILRILHEWGLNGRTTVQLGIGFHDSSINSLARYMNKHKGYTEAELERVGLISRAENGYYCDKMRNSIIIPTIDVDGNVVCFDAFIIDQKRLIVSSNSDRFMRANSLYSYNLAIRSQKSSVIVVSNYMDYYSLISRGFTNVVSTYLPQITEAQLALIKKNFKVVILLAPHFQNASLCLDYCQSNHMYCDHVPLSTYASVNDYLEQNAQALQNKIDAYERYLQ